MASTSVGEARARLGDRFRDLAYLHSPDDPFTLASGRQSAHFFDMKPVMMDPDCAHLLGVLIHAEIEGIGGVAAVGGGDARTPMHAPAAEAFEQGSPPPSSACSVCVR